MTILLQHIWERLAGTGQREAQANATPVAERPSPAAFPALAGLEVAPDDPLIGHFQSAPHPVEAGKLALDSPALRALKQAGVQAIVPLVSQGELIGLVNLGPRLGEQDYSTDERGLLDHLATQAAPAVRVAQLVRQQRIEAQARERLENEMRVARLVQQTLLPQGVPELPGWQIAAYYQPARAVGGDFYDFNYFADGRVGFIIGDVTDKGVPAALVMATTRAILRGAAQSLSSPGEILERANELLCPDIPPNMFVTCLYTILDPATGRLQYANAGHDLPYWRHARGVTEMRATGMPLGCMPDMNYEEREVILDTGDSVLLHSDGLVEAHNPRREMFGFPRLSDLMGRHAGGAALIPFLLEQLAAFTGPGWEQEDDLTFVTIQRASRLTPGEKGEAWRTLSEFELPSEPGNERGAMKRVAEAVAGLGLPGPKLERLKTAVAEATMNAIEHGNENRPELLVDVAVRASEAAISVSITDHGGGPPAFESPAPDLEAKLAGLQTPRGWGLFLIEKMVDSMRVTTDGAHHTIELIMFRKDE